MTEGQETQARVVSTAASPPPGITALPFVSAAGFASMASIRLADPMLPAMARDFGTQPADVSGAITFFALAYGLMQLAWGPLGDRLGKLRVIGTATIAATLGSIACALAPNLLSLELARLLTGVFCAAIIPMSIAWVGDVVPLDQRQATLARLSTGTITGMIVGQVAGGLLADWVSWRAAFALMAIVFLPAGLMVLRMHRRIGTPARSSAAGAPGRLQAFRLIMARPAARVVLLTALIEGAVLFAAMALIPTWLHEFTGMSLGQAGMAMAAMGIGGLLYSGFARRWISALGERRMVRLGASLITVSFLALVGGMTLAVHLQAPEGSLVVVLVAGACCAVYGLGMYMAHNTLQTHASQMSEDHRATAVGLFAVSLFMGQSAGVPLWAEVHSLVGHHVVLIGSGLVIGAMGWLLSGYLKAPVQTP